MKQSETRKSVCRHTTPTSRRRRTSLSRQRANRSIRSLSPDSAPVSSIFGVLWMSVLALFPDMLPMHYKTIEASIRRWVVGAVNAFTPGRILIRQSMFSNFSDRSPLSVRTSYSWSCSVRCWQRHPVPDGTTHNAVLLTASSAPACSA